MQDRCAELIKGSTSAVWNCGAKSEGLRKSAAGR